MPVGYTVFGLQSSEKERHQAMMSMTRLTGLTGADLTTAERALLRLLVSGWPLEEAAPALGLPPRDAERLLASLQSRCGATSSTRLLAIAVLNVWV